MRSWNVNHYHMCNSCLTYCKLKAGSICCGLVYKPFACVITPRRKESINLFCFVQSFQTKVTSLHVNAMVPIDVTKCLFSLHSPANCEHCFCLACIRKWRGSTHTGKKTIRFSATIHTDMYSNIRVMLECTVVYKFIILRCTIVYKFTLRYTEVHNSVQGKKTRLIVDKYRMRRCGCSYEFL